MEQYIQGQSRDLVDRAYTRLVSTMFTTLEKIAQSDPKYTDIILLENYAAFQNRIDDLMYTVPSEEIPFQLGLSRTDLRKVIKSSLSQVDRSINMMYRRLQKTLSSEELLPPLWDKCKKEFLEKYESFVQTAAKIYPNEPMPPVSELRDLLASS
ncbi:hypothetical protein Cni_G28372 [Canna indica]|uniref:Exocyst complex component Sec3 C-terminal domain-containing protein n=1 Tax=Canna indica TaxID=4628 RepID=A0AAQ3L380_9LILI|nr:hypothetical protein Cni_G28372 [Canna indica]